MKLKAVLLALLGTVAIVSAGYPAGTPVLLEAVGPNPEVAKGVLMVYSATEEVGNEDPSVYSGYRIYSNDGTMVANVQDNGNIGFPSDEPRKVTLPRGMYVVEAEAENFGPVKVPVTIEDNRVTVVCLRGHSCQNLPQGDGADLVKLPNGQVVGWHASETASR